VDTGLPAEPEGDVHQIVADTRNASSGIKDRLHDWIGSTVGGRMLFGRGPKQQSAYEKNLQRQEYRDAILKSRADQATWGQAEALMDEVDVARTMADESLFNGLTNWLNVENPGAPPLSAQELKGLTESSPYFESLLNYYAIGQQVELLGSTNLEDILGHDVIRILLLQEGIVHEGNGRFVDKNTFVGGKPVVVAEGLADFQSQLVALTKEGYEKLGEATAELKSDFGYSNAEQAKFLQEEWGADLATTLARTRGFAQTGEKMTDGRVVTREENERYRIVSAVEALKARNPQDDLRWVEQVENLRSYVEGMGMTLEGTANAAGGDLSQVRISDPYHTGKGSMKLDDYIKKVKEENPIFAEMRHWEDKTEQGVLEAALEHTLSGKKISQKPIRVGPNLNITFDDGRSILVPGDRWNDAALSILQPGSVGMGMYTAEYQQAFMQFMDRDAKGDGLYTGTNGPGDGLIAFSVQVSPKIAHNQHVKAAAYFAGREAGELEDKVPGTDVDEEDSDGSSTTTADLVTGKEVTPGAQGREDLVAEDSGRPPTADEKKQVWEALEIFSAESPENEQLLRDNADVMYKAINEGKSPNEVLAIIKGEVALQEAEAPKPPEKGSDRVIPRSDRPTEEEIKAGKAVDYEPVHREQTKNLAAAIAPKNPGFEKDLKEDLYRLEYAKRPVGKQKGRNLAETLQDVFQIAQLQEMGHRSGNILKDLGLDKNPKVMRWYKDITVENDKKARFQGRADPGPDMEYVYLDKREIPSGGVGPRQGGMTQKEKGEAWLRKVPKGTRAAKERARRRAEIRSQQSTSPSTGLKL